MPYWNYLAHKRACESKQQSRAATISSLPAVYHSPLTPDDVSLLNTPVSLTASRIRDGTLSPLSVLHAYGKRTLRAQERTNCLTEILIPLCERWLSESQPNGDGTINLQGPLAGVPVSVKDTVNFKGVDSCIGYSKWVGKPAERDSPMVQMLRDAGAVPYVKTNVPITLLSFESTNQVFGRTDNPHVMGYSPGGSTGGEGALLAFGGSRIGIGTDVAGSVRVPAAWSGIYTIRCSTGRFPKSGNVAAQGGQEGVPAVYSPMTRTLEDLHYFFKAIMDMKPWEYDHTVHPIPWRDVAPEMEERKSIRWGIIRDDGVVTPTPAIRRALETTIHALELRGDTIVDITDDCPSPFETLKLASLLLNSDGCKTVLSHFQSIFEANDAGVRQLVKFFNLPWIARKMYVWWQRYVRRDTMWAELCEGWHCMSVPEQWKLVLRREAAKFEWHEYLNKKGVDFILCPVNALPSVPEDGMGETVTSCGYTFMWNMLDYSAGVLPVGKVKAERDAVSEEEMKRVQKSANGVMRRTWRMYDAKKMEGLPIAVQIVGRRLQEEKVLWGMERAYNALIDMGERYPLIEIEAETD